MLVQYMSKYTNFVIKVAHAYSPVTAGEIPDRPVRWSAHVPRVKARAERTERFFNGTREPVLGCADTRRTCSLPDRATWRFKMKMIKSLVLGSAAGLIAMGGAQAADLPVKAKAVEYVRICSLYGAGFYYIPAPTPASSWAVICASTPRSTGPASRMLRPGMATRASRTACATITSLAPART